MICLGWFLISRTCPVADPFSALQFWPKNTLAEPEINRKQKIFLNIYVFHLGHIEKVLRIYQLISNKKSYYFVLHYVFPMIGRWFWRNRQKK